jgi:hypothetical protein
LKIETVDMFERSEEHFLRGILRIVSVPSRRMEKSKPGVRSGTIWPKLQSHRQASAERGDHVSVGSGNVTLRCSCHEGGF